ncbi:MAG: hypothetical protein ACO3V5_09795, partial [Ilumatobacteraceae bacterium]
SDGSFALAILSDQADPTQKWTSVEATVGTVAFVGVSGLTLSTNEVTVQVNKPSLSGAVVDYSEATVLSVPTGPTTTQALTMDGEDGELLKASGSFTINVFGFVQASGSLAFQKSSGTIQTLSGETRADVTANKLLIGGSGLAGFIGYDNGNADASDDIGLRLSDGSFALAILSDQADPTQKWTSVEATVGTVAFVGVSDLTLSADEVTVQVNRPSLSGAVVDYTDATVLSVPTGPTTTQALTMAGEDGELLRASGSFTVDIFGFVQASGSLAFQKSTGSAETLKDGVSSTVTTNQLLIGGSGLAGFIGYDNGNADATDDIGLRLSDGSFALAILSDQADPTQKWTSVEATVGTVAFVGVSDLT